jgi:putative oxidoreductase
MRPVLLIKLIALHQRVESGLARWAAPWVDLGVRLYLAGVFFRAGLTKIQDWDTTLFLFQEEYHVPLLPPAWAAVAATAGELILPLLLAFGLAGRLGAVGLSVLNLMAVFAYWHVLGQPGQAAALTQHVLWGLLLSMLVVHGNGRLTLDRLVGRLACLNAPHTV